MKKLIALLLILILTAGTFPALAEDNITVLVNNQEVLFDAQPFIENDRVMVPVRAISEVLGITFIWDEGKQTAIGYLDNRAYIRISVGDRGAVVDSIKTNTDVPPLIKDDRLFIPLRFFSEALGADVTWLEDESTVQILVQPLFSHDFTSTYLPPPLYSRLRFLMPKGSTTQSVSFGKTAQVSSPNVIGDQLVVTTEELFLKSSGNLKEDVGHLGFFESSGETIQKDGFQIISYTNTKSAPSLPAAESGPTSSTTTFRRYLIKDEDGFLIKLDFSAPSNSWLQNMEQYDQMTVKVLDSLKMEEKKLNTAAHPETASNMRTKLLEGYVSYRLPDSGIAIQKITPVTEKSPYIHLYTKIENNEMDLRSDKAGLILTREPHGTLNKNTFTWKIYSDGTMYAEVIDECTGNIVYSLYGFAKTGADQNDMIEMISQIKFLSAPAKPVIYLYPETEMDVSVNLQLTGHFTFTYPQYNNGWKVTARPDGTILSAGKEYSYLFWEGIFTDFDSDFKEGFVVKGSESTEFLQQVLSKMGLTPKEYNEFIVYWAPKMQENEYNKVYFAKEEYEEAAKLTISPTPDSILRVFMVYEKAEEGTVLPPQKIEPFERKGFTVVEWGGRLIEAEK
jgi:hypothetical protein